MHKKYNCLVLLLTLAVCRSMEVPEDDSRFFLPKLTTLCADQVAQQVARSIECKKDITWIGELSEEVRHILNCSLIKYCGYIFWKQKNKKFSTQTFTKKLKSCSNHANKKLKIVDNEEEYEQIVELTKVAIKKPDDNGCLQLISPDGNFVVTSYLYEDKEYNQKHKTEIVELNNHYKAHALQSFWFPWAPFLNTIGGAEAIDSIKITPDSKCIVIKYILEILGNDYRWKNEEIAVWDSEEGSLVCNLYKRKPYCRLKSRLLINTFAISTDSSMIAVGYNDRNCDCSGCRPNRRSYEGYIDLFEISTGKLLHSFNALDLQSKNAKITSLAISPNNQCLIIGYDNNVIKTVSLDLSTIDFLEIIKNQQSSCLIS